MKAKMRSIEDIVSLVDSRSLIRSAFKGKLTLSEHVLPEFKADENYSSLDIHIVKGEDTLDYQGKIAEICKNARATGKHERLHAGVNEAVRNAYQHGNKKDPKKKVIVSYRTVDDNFEAVVSDQGGEINADFVPFILLHRFKQLGQPLSFYQFSGTSQPYENAGIGTYVIHMVADEVNYLRNSSGGLSVQMIVRKDRK